MTWVDWTLMGCVILHAIATIIDDSQKSLSNQFRNIAFCTAITILFLTHMGAL